MNIQVSHMPTPAGPLRIGVHNGAICVLGFAEQWTLVGQRFTQRMTKRFGDLQWCDATLDPAFKQSLDAYFAGEPAALDDVPMALFGTDFQLKVWAALRAIPYGQTCTYKELANAVGSAGAIRAVGTANGANPVSIIVPCHRVINTGGGLGGYAGGLERKQWLLAHEASQAFSLNGH